MTTLSASWWPKRSGVGVRAILLALAVPSGCTAPAFQADLASPHAFGRVPAIVDAASPEEPGERVSMAELVRQLDHSDAAVRLYAIGALQRQTNARFGYRWYRDREARRESVAAWEAWAAGQPR